MLNSKEATSTVPRARELDAVRALALLGICVVNVPFLAQPLESAFSRQSGLDGIVQFGVEWLFQGKFFVLFSFLFGWGFAMQMASAARAGEQVHARFLRRLLGLALIGIAHALLVFFGDILLLYAFLGLPLLLVHRLTPKQLLAVAAASLVIGVVSLLVLAVSLPAEIVAPPVMAGQGYLGGFTDAMLQRSRDWPLAFLFIALFNGPIAFAAFCAGLAAAKVGFFEPDNAIYASLRRRIPVLLVLGLPLNGLYAMGVSGMLGSGLSAALAFSSLAVAGPCLGAVYLVGMIEMARRGWINDTITAAGRMSLTIYVLEGILAGFVFNGHGLGWYGTVNASGCLLIAIAIFAVTHVLASFWLARFRQGPLEWILQRMTKGRNITIADNPTFRNKGGSEYRDRPPP